MSYVEDPMTKSELEAHALAATGLFDTFRRLNDVDDARAELRASVLVGGLVSLLEGCFPLPEEVLCWMVLKRTREAKGLLSLWTG